MDATSEKSVNKAGRNDGPGQQAPACRATFLQRLKSHRLLCKLLPVVWAPGLACVLAVTLVHWLAIEPAAFREASAQALSTVTAIAQSGKVLLRGGEADALQELLGGAASHNPSIRSARIFDAQGTIVSDSAGQVGQPVPRFDGPFADPQTLHERDADGATATTLRAPIFIGREFWGGADLTLRPASASAASALWLVWLSGAAAAAAASWLAFKLAAEYRERASRLAQALGEIKLGNLGARSGFEADDELGDIARALDAMAGELVAASHKSRQQITALEERVTVRTKTIEAQARELELLSTARQP